MTGSTHANESGRRKQLTYALDDNNKCPHAELVAKCADHDGSESIVIERDDSDGGHSYVNLSNFGLRPDPQKKEKKISPSGSSSFLAPVWRPIRHSTIAHHYHHPTNQPLSIHPRPGPPENKKTESKKFPKTSALDEQEKIKRRSRTTEKYEVRRGKFLNLKESQKVIRGSYPAPGQSRLLTQQSSDGMVIASGGGQHPLFGTRFHLSLSAVRWPTTETTTAKKKEEEEGIII
ncbi:hypothetical protein DAPPUDRAFT_245713 [Daphnia pulex]|uniref:Uncharacterized protein n=1 Tax=Daphnia pulex TaxID=6669 RepID=E9GNW7_DAPPU|nr:hypothetical protein DAPPUDRAFT_245713 [Daphnia pulex]|eukprot:EFX78874.1 hypothetical protein DAPPUDRAFT_245713 [Daphnia pulex]